MNLTIGISMAITLLLVISGCANKDVSLLPESSKQQNAAQNVAALVKEKDVLDNFNALALRKDVTISEIIQYIDENSAAVSQTIASTMVIGLERIQKEKLPKLQDKFGDSEAVEKALTKIYRSGLTSQSISSLEDKEVRDLLLEAQNSGFKVETAEGMFFPVIDYSVYKKYRNAVTQDIREYLEIMATESDKTPIKDAALMLSWSEILQRAMTQEKFIKDYSNSAKIEDMRQLLRRYEAYALFGANNTPLFSYDTKQMVPEAKQTYLAVAFDATNGSFSKTMNEYLAVLKKNDYKLTNAVQEYRNKASAEFH